MSNFLQQDLDVDDEKDRHPNLDGTIQETRKNTSKCSTVVPTIEFQNVWDINSFSVHQEVSAPGDSITSLTFGDDQHEFFLKLFPAGKDEECAAFLSIFLQINKCPNPKIQFRVNFTLETLDGPRGCPLNRNIVTINRGGIVTASKFYSIELLKNRAARYIPDDVLRITTDMIVYGEPSSHAIDPFDEGNAASPNGSSPSLPSLDFTRESSLEKLLKSGDHSDFELYVDGHVFKLHKAILSARSSYFEAMLKPGNKEFDESMVVIKDVSFDIMNKVIKFIYTLQLPDIDDATVDLIYAADRFLIYPLKNGLMLAMGRNITNKNIFTRLELAYRLQDDAVFKKAAKLFARYRVSLTATDEWKKLKENYPGLATEIIEKGWEQAEIHNWSSFSAKRRRTNS